MHRSRSAENLRYDRHLPLRDFERSDVTHGGVTYPVFRGGHGPAVIVMHEIPNLHPGVVAFGERVVAAGFTVYMPSLFGTPGAPVTLGSNLRSMLRACVSRELATWATGKTSPITISHAPTRCSRSITSTLPATRRASRSTGCSRSSASGSSGSRFRRRR